LLSEGSIKLKKLLKHDKYLLDFCCFQFNTSFIEKLELEIKFLFVGQAPMAFGNWGPVTAPSFGSSQSRHLLVFFRSMQSQSWRDNSVGLKTPHSGLLDIIASFPVLFFRPMSSNLFYVREKFKTTAPFKSLHNNTNKNS
jgi:hypothetical protein